MDFKSVIEAAQQLKQHWTPKPKETVKVLVPLAPKKEPEPKMNQDDDDEESGEDEEDQSHAKRRHKKYPQRLSLPPMKRLSRVNLNHCLYRNDFTLIAFAGLISIAMIAFEALWFDTQQNTAVFFGLSAEVLFLLFSFVTNTEQEDYSKRMTIGGVGILKSVTVLLMLLGSLFIEPRLVLHVFAMIFECVYLLAVLAYTGKEIMLFS